MYSMNKFIQDLKISLNRSLKNVAYENWHRKKSINQNCPIAIKEGKSLVENILTIKILRPSGFTMKHC